MATPLEIAMEALQQIVDCDEKLISADRLQWIAAEALREIERSKYLGGVKRAVPKVA